MAKLSWRYGSMSSGKSAALLMVYTNYLTLGRKAEILTAQVDDRYGTGRVTSRMGVSQEAKVFTRETVFDRASFDEKTECVLVDEAQFLTLVQVEQLHRLAATSTVAVIAFGLRADFRGKAFEGSAALGVLADDMEALRTLCACGKRATMNVRLDGSGRRVTQGEQVQIGGDESYQPACARCFYTERDAAGVTTS